MRLGAVITDIWGKPLHNVQLHQGLEVTWPLCDSRTAKMTLSVYHPACMYIRPLDRLLKVTYGNMLLFHGIILKPVWSGKAGTLEINAHDPTLKLKHAYHRYGDYVVDYGYPMDGTGLKALIESSVPIEPQLDRDIPSNGIQWGTDTYPRQGPRPTTDPPAEGDGIWGRVERGAMVWETINTMKNIGGAPEFEFEPIDFEHTDVDNHWYDGMMVQLHTATRIGTDKSDRIHFQFGYGQSNAEDFQYEPDGDVVRNYWVEVNPGGERGRDDTENRAMAHDEDSWEKYGIYGGWESAQAKFTPTGLYQRAKNWVSAYSEPPDFFSVDPKAEGPNVPQFLQQYKVGDTIRASGKRGYLKQELVGRIVSATIRQRDQAGGANVALECVPVVGKNVQPGDDVTGEGPDS